MTNSKFNSNSRLGLMRTRLAKQKRLPRTRPAMKTSAKGVGKLTGDVLAPMREKRAGLFFSICDAWREIVGDNMAAASEPLRLDWPKRVHEIDGFEPAILIVACDPAKALFIEAEASKWLSKINQFLGFHAVERLKILQQSGAGTSQSVSMKKMPKRVLPKVNPAQRMAIEDKLADIEDGPLKKALVKLEAARLSAKARSD